MKSFNLPDLGEGLDEAEIVEWHVAEGDRIIADQPLVSVETDKAVVEIPAPASGTVARIHVAAGDIAKVGAPLVDFEAAGREDQGTVVGALPTEEVESAEVRAARQVGKTSSVKAAPAVRALAQNLGLNIDDVSASGPGGSVTADDVKRAAKTLERAGPPEPLRGVRRAMARKMAHSHAEVVPTSVFDEADISAWAPDTGVTVRLINAVAAGCAASPALNVWYDSEQASRRLVGTIDLGIAVNTDDGLFVPVLRDIANRDAKNLRDGLVAMKRDVEARSIPPAELRGATITLSNFGVFGAGRHGALVVTPPQVAIVGAGRVRDEVRAIDGAPAVRRVMPLSLTFDHRVVTGAEATRFLAAMMSDLARAD